MAHITIDIPDDIGEARRADIAGWLNDLAKEITQDRPAIDDDPQVRAEVMRRIQRGMEEIEAGQGVDGHEAMKRIAERHGITLPE